MSIVVYISGHGFGHLAQIAPLLEVIHHRWPQHPLFLRTSLSPLLLRQRLSVPHQVLAGAVDIGVVQFSAIAENWPETRRQAADFFNAHSFSQQVEEEIERLKVVRPKMILSDISPLAFPVAKALGVAGIGAANLDWHDVYQPFLCDSHPEVLATIARAHAQASLLLRMPLHMPMPTFEQVVDLPLFRQPQRYDRQAIRHQLGLSDDQRAVVLVVFGGSCMPEFSLEKLRHMDDYIFLFFSAPGTDLPENVRVLNYGQPFTSRQLMQASDVVLCKPGYGVLSEAWDAACPVVYTPRQAFAEYAVMHTWLQQYAPAIVLSNEDFRHGHWQQALNCARQQQRAWPAITDHAGELALQQLALYL